MTGQQPGIGGVMTGAHKGACEPLTGTPYVGGDQLVQACGSNAPYGSSDYKNSSKEDAFGTRFSVQSPAKAAMAEMNKRLWETALDLMGSEGLAFESGYELRQAGPRVDSLEALAKYQFLRSRANSIEGGTSEIMRNILGERVLGLPGEPRGDKDMAWKDVPRS